MITFEDVRVEDHETYTVLPANVAVDLSWFLTKNGIAHYKASTYEMRTGRRKRVATIFTEEEMKEIIKPFVELGEDDFNPCMIVSHFNSEDLTKKALKMVQSPEDQDLKKKREDDNRKAMETLKLEEMMFAKEKGDAPGSFGRIEKMVQSSEEKVVKEGGS